MNTNLRDFKGEKFGCSMVHSSFGWFHHVPDCVAVYVLVHSVVGMKNKELPKICSRDVQSLSQILLTGFELKRKVFTDLAKDDDDVASKESVGNFWTN